MTKQYKNSKQRERLMELLRETRAHPSADLLYEKLKLEFPNLSMGTVYRNLAVLVEQGLVNKIDFGSTFDRYEAKIGDHYHFVCEKCGKIDDIEIPDDNTIAAVTANLTEYQVHYHRVELFGLCSKCSQ